MRRIYHGEKLPEVPKLPKIAEIEKQELPPRHGDTKEIKLTWIEIAFEPHSIHANPR
jgi:hypothetical protein